MSNAEWASRIATWLMGAIVLLFLIGCNVALFNSRVETKHKESTQTEMDGTNNKTGHILKIDLPR